MQEELTNHTHADGGPVNSIFCIVRQWDRSARLYNHEGYPSLEHGGGGQICKKREEGGSKSENGCKV